MHKKTKTFSTIIQSNKEAISKFYYKYIFLVIIFSTILVSVILYLMDTHIILFGDNETALGEYVKTMATVLGGALVVLGLWINNRRVVEQTRQNNIAEKGQINTRFKDAATLLGAEHVSTILSGVYALHQIAMETSTGHKSQRGYINIVHDILCAYIRENTATIKNEENGKAWRINEKPTIVIQTIIKVLFKNDGFIYSDLITDLSDCVFEDIYLDEANLVGVDFSRTKFIKSSFKNARFTSCYLEETFIDETDFSRTVFNKVVFDHSYIRDCKFVQSTIQNSDYWEVTFNTVNFKDAVFNQVDFKDSVFEHGVNFGNTLLENYSEEEIKMNSIKLTTH